MHDATPTGTDLRDEATALVVAAEPDWAEAAYQWVLALPSGTKFTSEDITDAIGHPLKADNRAVGGVMLGLSKSSVIIPTGFLGRSARPSRHAGILREWVRV